MRREYKMTEQLRQAPVLSRLVINGGYLDIRTNHKQHNAIKILMHTAADLIDAQAAEITALRKELGWVHDAATGLIEFAEAGHITGPTFADRVRVDNLITNLRDALKERK